MLERGKLNSGEQLDYAFGLVIGNDKGLPTVDHGGADAGYRSDMVRYPEQHFSVAVLCNSAEADPIRLASQVADLVLAKEIKAEGAATGAKEPAAKSTAGTAVVLTAEQMAAFTGLYWNREDDAFVKTFVKEGKLEGYMGGEELVLRPFGESRFHIADKPWGDEVEIHFIAASGDKPRRMERSDGGEGPRMYEAKEPFIPGRAELAEYTGAYVSEEIDPMYRLVLDEDKLSLVRLKHEAEILRPAVRDVFIGEIGTVRFVRNGNGHVSGFVLNGGRIQNFHFTKGAN
jgi:hypothetical protein